MDGLFYALPFAGFGATQLDPGDAPPVQSVAGRNTRQLRKQIRDACPKLPGVYGMLDAEQRLIYVGKAKCLRVRLLSYFRRKGRDPKAGRIIAHARSIVWERLPSDFAALLRELELIRRWRPRYNVQGQPSRRRRIYVCVGRPPAPYLFLARQPPAGVAACFGPIPPSWKAREAVRRLNDGFGLRDCSQQQTMHFADQAELFPVERAAGCLRFELGTCLGPCAGGCTRSAYAGHVRAVRAFLEGRDGSFMKKLEGEMTAAAVAQQYERAAALRDKLEHVRWLWQHLDRLRSTRAWHSFVYPVLGADDRELWYMIRGGQVVRVIAAPKCPSSRRVAASALEKVYAKEPNFSENLDAVLLVAAWFRRYPEERKKTLSPKAAAGRIGKS